MNELNVSDDYLMIPGPVPVASRIVRAMSKPMMSHRSSEFSKLYERCTEGLKALFGTENPVYILSGTGTLAMEAAVSNFLGDEDEVVCVVNGKFGDRFYRLAERYASPKLVGFEWGESFDLEKVEEAITPSTKAITFVHNETSVGILNPAEELGKIAEEHDCLLIMDGITSIGGDDVRMDEWGVDVAVVGSQKCLGIPPGLSMIAVSERAWEHLSERRPFYCDLGAYKKSHAKLQTPYTPALSLFFALDEALAIIEEEGLEARIKRHRKASSAIRAAMGAIGVEMFPHITAPSAYSNTVSAMKIPEGIDDKELRGGLQERGVIASGGQEHLKGRIFRLGTMGNFTYRQVLGAISIVESVLYSKGILSEMGKGVGAASRIIEG
ncbi:MAG: pyridoxal-phosphate-dependent aminotransferase family protein [Methermicoccaceae archaeon]